MKTQCGSYAVVVGDLDVVALDINNRRIIFLDCILLIVRKMNANG